MTWWLIYWAVGSAVFFVGWVLGAVTVRAKDSAPAAGEPTYCWRCYVDLISERVAGEAAVVMNGAASPPSHVP